LIVSVIISVVGIIGVVREVGVSTGSWVVRPVAGGLVPSLAGVGHVYVAGGWVGINMCGGGQHGVVVVVEWEWMIAGEGNIAHIARILLFC